MIKCAAIKYEGEVYSLPKPSRHHNILHMMIKELKLKKVTSGEQGFLTENGEFVDRIEAGKIALSCGQCDDLVTPPRLFSEDLW
jgi:hypothetical protein